MKAQFNKTFQQQSDFFAKKLAIPSERWDDLRGVEHDHGFMVAGATKADLVNDFRRTIQQSIDEGKSIQWFRKNFDEITQKHGWTGWTGEDSKAGRAWRTKTIYATNLKTSYAAGRYAQMNDPDVLAARPYRRYVHSPFSKNPRSEHLRWHNLVLPADDPFWQTHTTPNGFGCNCDIEALTEEEAKKYGISPSPKIEYKRHINRDTGEVRLVPEGITPGFDYQPGRSATETALAAQRQKVEKLDTAIARKNIQSLVNSDAFLKFWSGRIDGEFPIAVLHEKDQKALQAESPVILLSQASLTEHKEKHRNVGLRDYRNIQALLDKAKVWQQAQDKTRLTYIMVDGVQYKAVLKRTQDGGKNYFLTLYQDNKGRVFHRDKPVR